MSGYASRTDRIGITGLDCDDGQPHRWQPVQLLMETGDQQPDTERGKCFVVCLGCNSWSYAELEWAGFMLSDPRHPFDSDEPSEAPS